MDDRQSLQDGVPGPGAHEEPAPVPVIDDVTSRKKEKVQLQLVISHNPKT
jgi:hypothetical protein